MDSHLQSILSVCQIRKNRYFFLLPVVMLNERLQHRAQILGTIARGEFQSALNKFPCFDFVIFLPGDYCARKNSHPHLAKHALFLATICAFIYPSPICTCIQSGWGRWVNHKGIDVRPG